MKAKTTWWKRCAQFLWSKYETRCLKKYYNSIQELPLINWFRLYNDTDLKHLLKHGSVDRFAPKVYEKLQDQIIDQFGIGDDYEHQLRLQIEIALMEIDIALTENRINQIFVDRLKDQLKEIRSKQKETKSNPYESLYHIERNVGYKLDPFKVTVFEFFNYSEQIKNNKAA